MELLSFKSQASLFMPPIALGNLPFSIALVRRSVESFTTLLEKYEKLVEFFYFNLSISFCGSCAKSSLLPQFHPVGTFIDSQHVLSSYKQRYEGVWSFFVGLWLGSWGYLWNSGLLACKPLSMATNSWTVWYSHPTTFAPSWSTTDPYSSYYWCTTPPSYWSLSRRVTSLHCGCFTIMTRRAWLTRFARFHTASTKGNW